MEQNKHNERKAVNRLNRFCYSTNSSFKHDRTSYCWWEILAYLLSHKICLSLKIKN